MSFPKFPMRRKHCWFSGRILACHAGDRGSIPRQCTFYIDLQKLIFWFTMQTKASFCRNMNVSSRKFLFCCHNEIDDGIKTLTAVGFEPTPPK